jgi:hypothetical protein
VANSAFSQTFGECSVTNLITTSSDHYDILISLQNDPSRRANHQFLIAFDMKQCGVVL